MKSTLLLILFAIMACQPPTPTFKCEPAEPVEVPQPIIIEIATDPPPAAVKLRIDDDADHPIGHIVMDMGIAADMANDITAIIDRSGETGLDALVVEINSLGGSLEAGFRIARSMERAKTPIVCVVDNKAYSAAYYILQSCDVRLMTARSLLMLHEARMDIPSGFLERSNGIENIKQTNIAMIEQNCGRLYLDREECFNKYKDGHEWWINAFEALDVGAVDGVSGTPEELLKALRYDLKKDVDKPAPGATKGQ